MHPSSASDQSRLVNGGAPDEALNPLRFPALAEPSPRSQSPAVRCPSRRYLRGEALGLVHHQGDGRLLLVGRIVVPDQEPLDPAP